jgi:DNA primase
VSKTLFDIFEPYNPKLLSSGQIRTQCPFRDKHSSSGPGDGSTSFFLSPDKNFFKCFSCGTAGNITALLINDFDIPKYEALKLVSFVDYKDEFAKKSKEFELQTIWSYDVPPKVFTSRGISPDILRKHKVGYTDSRLVVIPLYFGKVLKGLAFRRTLPSGKKEITYTEGFNRESYLYNYNSDFEEVIVVEGFTDNWVVEQHGLPNVVATLGTEVAPNQIKLLSKFRRLLLAHDQDKAGLKASLHIYKELKNDVDSIRFVDYHAADPGESTKEDFLLGVKNSINYAEFKYLTGS